MILKVRIARVDLLYLSVVAITSLWPDVVRWSGTWKSMPRNSTGPFAVNRPSFC